MGRRDLLGLGRRVFLAGLMLAVGMGATGCTGSQKQHRTAPHVATSPSAAPASTMTELCDATVQALNAAFASAVTASPTPTPLPSSPDVGQLVAALNSATASIDKLVAAADDAQARDALHGLTSTLRETAKEIGNADPADIPTLINMSKLDDLDAVLEKVCVVRAP